MINEGQTKKYCRDDISKIENYDKAIADKTQTWICHHRLGLTLDGEFAHSHEDLKRLGMYYDRPYFELQFLTLSEHRRLHRCGRTHTVESRKKMSEAKKGKSRKPFSDETRKKMSAAKKGRKNHNYGKKMSDEQKRKISEAQKRRFAANKKKSEQSV